MLFLKRLKEAALAVLPITILVLILNFSIKPMDSLNTVSFVIGAILLIVGMGLYSLGVDTAIQPMGEHIGDKVSGSKKIWFIILCIFIIGFIVTIAEPDLTVLATQVSIDSWTLILVISFGVGLFMIIAVLRMILKISLNIVLIILYVILFIMTIFVDKQLIPLAFDSGGVTTGPITVPFIMTLGVGLGATLGGGKSQENSFGVVGICSIGPIIAVVALCLINRTESSATITELTAFSSFGDVLLAYLKALPKYLKEVGIALAPICGFFFLLQFLLIKLPKKRLLSICIGIIYTYIGLTLFLTGVNVGFMPTGTYIGSSVADFNKYLIIPIGMVVGACIVLAEPAIHVLTKQVENVTGGTISKKSLLIVLIISMAIAIGLAMTRVVTGISILYILVPGYAIALILTFFVPKIFTGIAFDSGGVASGPMTATFLLPFAMGACQEIGGNILSDAFGTVALVALTPLVTLQILGLVFKIKSSKLHKAQLQREFAELLTHEGEIIELDTEV